MSMKASGEMINKMEMVFYKFYIPKECIKVNGEMGNCMAQEQPHMKMVPNIKDNSNKEKNMVWEY